MIINKLLITPVNYPIFRNRSTLSCLLSLRLMRCSHSYKSVEKSENNSIVKKQYKAYKRTKKTPL